METTWPTKYAVASRTLDKNIGSSVNKLAQSTLIYPCKISINGLKYRSIVGAIGRRLQE